MIVLEIWNRLLSPYEHSAAELRAENARLLREAVERLGLLNKDKDAVIAGLRAQLAEQIARLER